MPETLCQWYNAILVTGIFRTRHGKKWVNVQLYFSIEIETNSRKLSELNFMLFLFLKNQVSSATSHAVCCWQGWENMVTLVKREDTTFLENCNETKHWISAKDLDHKHTYNINCLCDIKLTRVSFCSPFTGIKKVKND